jgi:hypothetical protein
MLAPQEREGVPSTSQGLVYAGRQLNDESLLASYGVSAGSTLHLVLRLLGGKGGFGALLRGQGRDGKTTTNFDACRDLQGRRIRHQRTEQQLAEWKSQAKERELEKIALKHIKEQAKQQRREAREEVSMRPGSGPCACMHVFIRRVEGSAWHGPFHLAPASTFSCCLHSTSQVDLEQIAVEQKKAIDNVTDAVQSALKEGLATTSASGAASGSGKRKTDEAAGEAGAAAGSNSGAVPPKPAAKKARMLAFLEEVEDDSDDESEEEDA